MLKFEEGEDVFFDSVESFRNCDTLSSYEAAAPFGGLDYQIWNSQPVSVLERRERFLRGTGFSEFLPLQLCRTEEINQVMSSTCNFARNHGLERIGECSGAVSSSSCSYSDRGTGMAGCTGRDFNGRTVVVSHEVGQSRTSSQLTRCEPQKGIGILPSAQQLIQRETTAHGQEHFEDLVVSKTKIKSWWNRLVQKKMKEGMRKSGSFIRDHKAPKANRMKVRHNRKRCMECTAVYMGQQIQAHKGFIWTMKFSPDGKYLASGGEDGVVRVWRVMSTDATFKNFTARDPSKLDHKTIRRKLIPGRKRSKPASIAIPPKLFKIDESPLHEFYGHADEVLDICWSKSNCLLSSSKDETVRLWKVGVDDCLQVFHHNNYVTCIQFNPVDDGYFISGSIDGKVRVWGVSESRVVDWADVRDIITAVCYQPDGQGFIVGSISGHCRFYDASSNHLQLDAQICIQSRKKSSNNRITGFQVSPEDAQKVMITSADSKVRIFDGLDIIHKYRGLRKSGSQMSASFTSNGRHIISVGEDSRVYVWNCDGLYAASSKQAKSIRSCEHFFFEGVSLAIPWLGTEQEGMDSSVRRPSQTVDHLMPSSLLKYSARFSLGGWFSMDGRLRGLATWPEEKLPLWSVSVEEDDYRHEDLRIHVHAKPAALASTWGLVIVTGGWDGVVRTFHNYGLPTRL